MYQSLNPETFVFDAGTPPLPFEKLTAKQLKHGLYASNEVILCVFVFTPTGWQQKK
jgi:hypothetical protein